MLTVSQKYQALPCRCLGVPTFLQCHGPVSLPGRVEVAGGLARLREVEAVEDALVGEAPEPTLPVLGRHPAVIHQT